MKLTRFYYFGFFVYILLSVLACSQSSPDTATATSGGEGRFVANKTITAQQIIDRIKENVTCEWREKTVDTFKGGDPNTVVTGVACTFLCNMDVLKKAKAKGMNLIITHEPTFYNHLDETAHLGDDPVLAEKQKFIEDNDMVVWRFHDHWHYTQPDGIYEGMMAQLGWKDQRSANDAFVYELEQQSLSDLAKALKKLWNTESIKVVGPADMSFTKVGFAAGAVGYQAHLDMLRRDDVEVLMIGEVNEWETVEYVRDAISQGRKKALILTGHANSEEAGMAYCAEWMKAFVKEVPVELVAAGDPFWAP